MKPRKFTFTMLFLLAVLTAGCNPTPTEKAATATTAAAPEASKAPDTGCDKANVGKEVRVDYKATYYFYVAKP
jgi:hypothetical protein